MEETSILLMAERFAAANLPAEWAQRSRFRALQQWQEKARRAGGAGGQVLASRGFCWPGLKPRPAARDRAGLPRGR